LSEDGAECVDGDAHLATDGHAGAAALARRLLDGASPELRALFAG